MFQNKQMNRQKGKEENKSYLQKQAVGHGSRPLVQVTEFTNSHTCTQAVCWGSVPCEKGHCRQVEESYSAHPGMVRYKAEPGETAPHTIFHAGCKYSKLSNEELEIHGNS